MGRLSRNVVANMLAAGVSLGSALAAVPLIVDRVGVAGYGIWTLALTAIVYITTTEAGVGPAVQRYTAVAHGGADLHAAARLLWSTLALYIAFGVVLMAALALLAPTLVELFDVERGLAADAEEMFRIAGLVGLIALLGAGLGNVQQGLERYLSYTVASAVGAVAFLVGIVVALENDAGLSGLAWAAAAQQGVIVVLRAIGLRDVMATGPGIVSRGEAREIGGFALRVQMTVASMIVNLQTDRIVVGLIASGRTLGQLGIGAQVAEAGRLVGGAALAPMVSRMSVTHGGADPSALEPLFARLQRLWMLTILGGTAIGIATMQPLIEAWLGPGHGDAVLLGSFLVAAQGINLSTGTGVAYLRAVGRPSIEARLGAITIVANVALTITLGLAFGAVGVVVATTCAFAIGTAWFFRRLRDEAPAATLAPPPRAVLAALVAGLLSLGWGLAMVELLGRWGGLAPVIAGAGAALAAYLSWTTGVRPTAANLRALFA